MSMPAQTHRTRTRVLAALAMTGAAALVLSGCSAGPIEDMTLSLATVLPLTVTEIDPDAVMDPDAEEGIETEPPLREVPGNGAAAEAAVALAVSEINAADRYLTIDAKYFDSGDAGNTHYDDADTQAALASSGLIIGPGSVDIAEALLPSLIENKALIISPLDRSSVVPEAAGAKQYWRTAPVLTLEGITMAQLMFSKSASSLVIVSSTDAEYAAQATALSTEFDRTAGPVVELIGMAGEGPYYNVADAALHWRADAVAIIAPPAQTAELLSIMLAAGADPESIYLNSESTADFAATAPGFSIASVNGILPLPPLSESFIAALQEQYTALHPDEALADATFTALGDYSGAAEAYESVIASALAALAARSTDGDKIAAKLREITGGMELENVVECVDYVSCVDLLEEGNNIRYTGMFGALSFTAERTPSNSVLRAVTFDAKSLVVLPVDEESADGDAADAGDEVAAA